MKKLSLLILSCVSFGCLPPSYYTTGTTYGCSNGYYDQYGNCISFNNVGVGTCHQYDSYGNCVSVTYNDGTHHSYGFGGYHQNSKGEVYDNNGNRMPQYE